MAEHETLRDPVDAEPTSVAKQTRARKDFRFRLVLLSLLISLFLAILPSFAVSTALPVIVEDLHGLQFIWILSAYGVTSTALLPFSGGLAEIFGHRPVLLTSLFIFAVGSALSGSAQSINMLIAGRAIQGAGSGGLLALTQIVLSDMVTLQERGIYNGLFGLTWAIAGGLGPVIGGALAKHTTWRWLFYLLLPITGVVFALIFSFLRLPTPQGTLREKLKKIDWLGNGIVIASTCACIIALSWGGITFPWSSAHVLAPLVIGLVGIAAFIIYETIWCSVPILPLSLVSNRTSLSGYLQIFLCSFILTNVVYYMPVYYQACKDSSPIGSGVALFGVTFTTAPFSVIAGASVRITKRYRPQMWVGWAFMILGLGLMTTIRENMSRGMSVGFQILTGVGIGLVYSTAYFPVLTPLPVSLNAHALACYTFFRTLAQAWAVTIGGAILQNGLQHKLPPSLFETIDSNAGIAYSLVPQIPSLTEPLKDDVRSAFARSLATVWVVLVALAAVGFAVSLPMKGLLLHEERDARWAMQDHVDETPISSSPEIREKMGNANPSG